MHTGARSFQELLQDFAHDVVLHLLRKFAFISRDMLLNDRAHGRIRGFMETHLKVNVSATS